MGRTLLQQEEEDYLLEVQRYCLSPIIQRYYNRVALCSMRSSTHADLPFYVVEFQFKQHYALSWRDERNHWVLGEWYRPNDYYGPVALSLDYFRGNYAFYSFEDLLDALVESRPNY